MKLSVRQHFKREKNAFYENFSFVKPFSSKKMIKDTMRRKNVRLGHFHLIIAIFLALNRKLMALLDC